MKTETRKVAEKIQAITGQSLVKINWIAAQYVSSGMFSTQLEALTYILDLENE